MLMALLSKPAHRPWLAALFLAFLTIGGALWFAA